MPAANVYDIRLSSSAFQTLMEAHIQNLSLLDTNDSRANQATVVAAYFRAVKCRQTIKLRRISTYKETPNMVGFEPPPNYNDLDQRLEKIGTALLIALKVRFGLDLPKFETDPGKTLSDQVNRDDLPHDWQTENRALSNPGAQDQAPLVAVNLCPQGYRSVFCSHSTNRCVSCRGPVFYCPQCQVIHSQNLFYYNDFVN